MPVLAHTVLTCLQNCLLLQLHTTCRHDHVLYDLTALHACALHLLLGSRLDCRCGHSTPKWHTHSVTATVVGDCWRLRLRTRKLQRTAANIDASHAAVLFGNRHNAEQVL
jgi:hypothetical protein